MSTKTDMQKLSDKELSELVSEKRAEVRAFRFGTAGSAARDVRKVRTAKKDIARALTELTRRTRSAKSQ